MKLYWKQNAGAFLISQLFSVLGSSLVQYSITWYITLQTKSGIYMTISLLCTIIPTLILSPFSGVWADRYNKRNLIILADLSIAAVTLIAAVLFAIDQGSVIVLFIALFLRSLGQAIHNPAINSFIPELVPDEHLTKLNGINGTIQNFIQIIGPIIAALLISFCDLQYIFFIDIFTAIISTCIILLFIKTERKTLSNVPVKNTYFEDIKTGLHYIKNTKFLSVLLLYFSVQVFLLSPVYYLTPLFITQTFSDSIWSLSLLEICLTGGMMLGSVFISIKGDFSNKFKALLLSGLFSAAMTATMGMGISIWIFLISIIIFGICNAIFSTICTTFIQQSTDERFLGRVFSFLMMLNSVLGPIGMSVFGPLADFIPISYILITSSVLLFLSVIAVSFSKSLKEKSSQLTPSTPDKD